MVFVEDAADPVASGDAEVVEVGDVVRQGAQRCGVAQGAVWPVLVLEGLVLRQDPAQVGEVPHEGAIE